MGDKFTTLLVGLDSIVSFSIEFNLFKGNNDSMTVRRKWLKFSIRFKFPFLHSTE